MPWTFNPFTGSFDQKGSGGGGGASYIDGEVATYNDLPLDGTAALNSAWLVRTASGVWPVSRKQAGIYIRTATGGSSRDADYTYAGTMPDVFSDSVFLLYDEASTTRTGQFNLGSITAGQNRVLTWPNASGTISLEGHTHAAADVTSGTLDNARINFAAPGAIGGTTSAAGTFTTLTASTSLALTGGIITGASNVIEQVNSTNAQTFRLYNTQSGTGGANFERLRFAWASNVAIIGTEKGGTGSARSLEFQIDGTTRLTLTTGGNTQLAFTSSLVFASIGRLIPSSTDGVIRITNIGDSDFGRLQFGGTTSSFPALKRSSATLQVRLADDSGYSVLDAQLRAQGTAPATSGATGTAGDIRYDADYIYVCTATNTWKRAAIATW